MAVMVLYREDKIADLFPKGSIVYAFSGSFLHCLPALRQCLSNSYVFSSGSLS